jgi:hypothetical protein
VAQALGTDLDDRIVYALTAKGEVIGIDLISRQSRPYLSRTTMVSGSPDGTVLGIDSAGRPQRFISRNLTTFRGTVAAGPGTRLVGVRGKQIAAYAPDRGVLQVFEEEGEVRQLTVPDGHLASSWFGDLLMVTSAEGITLIDPTRDATPTLVRLTGMPLAGEFSPSAHRIYVARARGDILVLDRFGAHTELGRISIPGPASALRPDRSGRWLLAHPEQADSVWLIDLVRQELVATLAAPWDDDLPLVTGGRTLVMRDGNDVVGFDLSGPTPLEFTRLAGGAGDIFLAVPWVPEGRHQPIPTLSEAPEVQTAAPGLAEETGLLASDEPGPDPVPEARPGAEIGGEVYIQVNSSQNVGWSQALADDLRAIGYRASVLDPSEPGGSYRVVVGPYPSRDEAEADGNRLGRPYFVTTRGNRNN